ncbi:hypothetical protein AVEN_52175-1 [Araneus ventricosus]|uniref:Uncharacterized protein n=1 Tax=Araneus ventricosus TaxID=182803 RepID=A0A4Y2WQR3_ARAVE|nr:hypothetical protein AVEN_52175-1 [Araneus ventricosus]
MPVLFPLSVSTLGGPAYLRKYYSNGISFGKPDYDVAEMDPAVADVAGSLKEVKLSQKPVCLIVLGMAGSGKTTFVQRITSHLHAQYEQKTPPAEITIRLSQCSFPARH